MTFLGCLSDPFQRLSDLQLGNQKVTMNHLVYKYYIYICTCICIHCMYIKKTQKYHSRFLGCQIGKKKNQLGKPQGAPTSLGHIHKIPNSELFLGVVFQVLPKEGLSNICPKQGSEKRFLIAEEQE